MSELGHPPAPPIAADPARPAAVSVRLPIICRLRDLSDLRQQLLARLPMLEPVAIDASEVESIDTAALQLLHAFERDRARRSRTTLYTGASQAFRTAVATLGLTMSLSTTIEH